MCPSVIGNAGVRDGGSVAVGVLEAVGVTLGVREGPGVNVGREEGDGEGVSVWVGLMDGVAEAKGSMVGMVWGCGERARIERKIVKIKTRIVNNAYKAINKLRRTPINRLSLLLDGSGGCDDMVIKFNCKRFVSACGCSVLQPGPQSRATTSLASDCIQTEIAGEIDSEPM